MKKEFFAFFTAAALLSGCCCPKAAQKDAGCPVKAKIAEQLQLQLPPAIYAIPGVEMNVYFANLVLAVNPANYVFDVECPKGRNDQKRWRFTPTEQDVGTYDWKVSVINESGVIATASTKLIVTRSDAGKGKKITLLVIGDSLTAATVYPAKIAENFRKPGNPELKQIGTTGNPAKGAAHEGYGGWAWKTFTAKVKPTVLKPGQKKQRYHVASPFIFDGKFDFGAYLKKQNGGKAPDFITVQLGVNDIFHANDSNGGKRIEAILADADKLLAGLRKDAPDAVIGVGLVTPGAITQDAFGSNYNCGQTGWQYRKNQHRLNAAMLKKFAAYPDKKVFLIPTCTNLDTENNFPSRQEPRSANTPKALVNRQSNGVHPAGSGYEQIGDTFYCWMKYHLAK